MSGELVSMEKLDDGDFELSDMRLKTGEKEADEAAAAAADAEDDDDIVITGISGVFPGCLNLEELERNLRLKLNLISVAAGAKHSSLGIGKIPNIEKFDASYFGLKSDLADTMDPMGRLLLEKTYETIVDSGYNPHSLREAKVGVFIGVYMSETEAAFFGGGSPDGLTVTGIGRCFLANRISYCFGFHGPSLCVDTACSSSMLALHLARQAMKNGDCDSAIVGGCNLCLNNGFTLHLQRLGVVSMEGVARVLDEAGNGYCRSETVCTIFLQKRKHARRIYASLIHTKVNCDGYKAEGITYPSFVMQRQLLSDFYRECNVPPSTVDWVELHATGTRAGDREEIKSVSVFCENRASALKVGSIRSNMGHAEAASTMCSIAKVIIAMRSGLIPPNINYTTPRNDIDALHNGLVQVITENTPCKKYGLVGINSFGLGGANGHALLKSYEKSKSQRDSPPRENRLPIVVAISGRTREAVDVILTELEKNPIDDEFVGLLHEIHSRDIVQHLYRGVVILRQEPIATPTAERSLFKEIARCPIRQRPLWLVFSGVGCQWAGMGRRLMRLPIFAESVAQCDRVLRPFNVDLIRILSDGDDPKLLQNVVNCFVGITAVQIAFVDVLRALNVPVAGMTGHSAGEIACAYADNCLTKEQTILCAYYRGLSCAETRMPNGAMAAIGLGHDELKNRLPDDVDIACRNSICNCTISGPVETINNLVSQFQNEKIFARRVESSNMAFHSRYVVQVAPKLMQYLQKVIPNPKIRSDKWISTSVSETCISNKESDEMKYCSATYMTKNVLNQVLFEEAAGKIEENAIVIEVSPHSLLRTILKQTCGPELTYIALGTKQCQDSVQYFLKAIAKLYLLGETLKFHNLYPSVNYPISKETRMIAPLIRWQHDKDWNVVFSKKEDMIPGERRYAYNAKIKELAYMFDHVIDGRNIVPGYIYLLPIWETIPLMYDRISKDTSIVFENLRFKRMVNVYRDKPLDVLVHIQKGSGNFEIVESNQVVLSGRAYVPDDVENETLPLATTDFECDDIEMPLNLDDIYKEFQLRGYEYKNLFRQMLSSNFDGSRARVKWNENWITFLDTISQTYILQTDTRFPCLLTGIEKVTIDVDKHNAVLQQNLEYQEKGIPVYVDKEIGVIQAGGVQIRGIKGHIIPRRKLQTEPQLFVYKFIPYIDCRDEIEAKTFFGLYARLLWENFGASSNKLKILEYECSHSKGVFYSKSICQALDNYPHIQVNATVACSDTTIGHMSDSTTVLTVEKPVSKDDTHVKYIPVDEREELERSHADAHFLIVEYDDQLPSKMNYLIEAGFLMIRFRYETTTELPASLPSLQKNFTLCCEHRFNGEKIITYRRTVSASPEPVCLKVTPNFDWLNELKETIKDESKRIILYAQDDPFTGLQGFFSCLRKEICPKNISCFVILDDDAAPFSTDHSLYQGQISKYLLVNVYKDKSWGCYAHLPMAPTPLIKTPYAFANVATPGDLRTLKWYEGSVVDAAVADVALNSPQGDFVTKLIHVYYSALNFKDVLLATGVLSFEAFVPNRLMQECLIGCEFSGRDAQGKRYMGIYPAGAICTMLLASTEFLWQIPDKWSLEEAATVPIIYLTTIAAFFVHGDLKRGESVLIHSGAGGVGQAAINVATYYECEIFTTVGTAEKREFIRKTFPHIDENHIGRSRDTSFEQMVMTRTGGRGVDIVLNSLTGDKLLASVRCLAKGGRFLEIGKLDLLEDNPLGMNVFLRGISFHCVLLDKIHEEKTEIRNQIMENFRRELKSGSIKPIVRTVFDADNVEAAFRYMGSGKHIGKVLLKIRDQENDLASPPSILPKDAVPRFNCRRGKVYIICGGLGGMGLELADWLVLRGARKLILISREGAKNGYQKLRLKRWKSYGVTVLIRTDDITKADQVQRLLTDAESLGPVDAIFNLAAVIDDQMLENQEIATFEKVIAPKKTTTRLLDEFSSKLCPTLEHFVVFSTLSCSYGNAAQTNYGFANACCERICEKRKERGLPALAVQWGAVDEVGMFTRLDVDKTCSLVGLKAQPIRSCLNVMDKFLKQADTIVSSFILSDKSCDDNKGVTNLLETVANILGIKDTKNVSMYSPLPELGMDSISALEVKQTLEQRYDLFLSPRELMLLTFATLDEIQKTGKKSAIVKKDDTNVMASVPHLRNVLLNKTKKSSLFESTLLVELPSISSTTTKRPEPEQQLNSRSRRIIFCFPPIDGIAETMEALSKNLPHQQLLCFQYVAITDSTTVAERAEIFASHIVRRLAANEPFNIIAYSYGVIIAMETLKILQNENRKGNVVLIDGSLEYAKALKSVHFAGSDHFTRIQTKILRDIACCVQPTISKETLENYLNQLGSWEAKTDYVINEIDSKTNDGETLKFVANYMYHAITSAMEYHYETQQKFDTRVAVIRAKKMVIPMPVDTGLNKYFVRAPEEFYVDENHFTILPSKTVAEIIQRFFEK